MSAMSMPENMKPKRVIVLDLLDPRFDAQIRRGVPSPCRSCPISCWISAVRSLSQIGHRGIDSKLGKLRSDAALGARDEQAFGEDVGIDLASRRQRRRGILRNAPQSSSANTAS